ncbi:MAG: DUF4129 domain-containing protein [Anaerolineae bacterium]
MSSRLPTVLRSEFSTANGRREVIYVALAAAEICWAAPVFLLAVQARSPHSPASLWLGMLALLLGFFYIYRLLMRADFSMRRLQVLLVGILLLSIVLMLRFHVYADAGLSGIDWFLQPIRSFTTLTSGIPLEFITMLTLIYLWARGIHLARRSISGMSVGFSFRSGVLVVAGLTLAMSLLGSTDTLGFIILYFFFALLAVALARIEEVSRAPNSTRVRFSGFWIGATVASVGVLVVAGIGVAVLFYGGTLEAVLRWLLPLLIVFQLLVVGIAYIVFMVIEFILTVIPVNWDALMAAFQEVAAAFGNLAFPINETAEVDPEAVERTMGAVQGSCLTSILVLIVLAVIIFAGTKLLKGRDQDAEESRESTLSAGALANNLRAMLQAGRDRLSQLAGLVDQYGLGSHLLSAITIRRIYANLVRLATKAGYPRLGSQTPYEYRTTLQEVFPGRENDIALITEAYVSAHYGQLPDNREELQQIRDCWERIRSQGAQTPGHEGT